jgi:hypothetical protein
VTEAWVPDDPAIPDDEICIRRVPRKPNCLVPNASTGDVAVGNGAIRFDDDGMSVHLESLREKAGVDRADMYDWNRYTAVEFPAAAPRQLEEDSDQPMGGVVLDPQEDPPLGDAHALVRTREQQPNRKQRGDIRAAIRARATFIAEDPRGPAAPEVLGP